MTNISTILVTDLFNTLHCDFRTSLNTTFEKESHNNVKRGALLIIDEENDVIENCITVVYTFDKMELTMIIIYCSAH